METKHQLWDDFGDKYIRIDIHTGFIHSYVLGGKPPPRIPVANEGL